MILTSSLACFLTIPVSKQALGTNFLVDGVFLISYGAALFYNLERQSSPFKY